MQGREGVVLGINDGMGGGYQLSIGQLVERIAEGSGIGASELVFALSREANGLPDDGIALQCQREAGQSERLFHCEGLRCGHRGA